MHDILNQQQLRESLGLGKNQKVNPITDRIHSREYHINTYSLVNRVYDTFGANVLKKLKNHVRSRKILDSGCSTGLTTVEMASLFPDATIVGLDFQKRKLGKDFDLAVERYGNEDDNAREDFKKRISFVQGDMYFPSFQRRSFKAIFMMNNFLNTMRNTNISDAQVNTIMSNVGNLLEEDGWLCLSDEDNFFVYHRTGDQLTKSHLQNLSGGLGTLLDNKMQPMYKLV